MYTKPFLSPHSDQQLNMFKCCLNVVVSHRPWCPGRCRCGEVAVVAVVALKTEGSGSGDWTSILDNSLSWRLSVKRLFSF